MLAPLPTTVKPSGRHVFEARKHFAINGLWWPTERDRAALQELPVSPMTGPARGRGRRDRGRHVQVHTLPPCGTRRLSFRSEQGVELALRVERCDVVGAPEG